MKLKIEIELGNDALLSYIDIANILDEEVVRRLEVREGEISPLSFNIKDYNGNYVGEFTIEE